MSYSVKVSAICMSFMMGVDNCYRLFTIKKLKRGDFNQKLREHYLFSNS